MTLLLNGVSTGIEWFTFWYEFQIALGLQFKVQFTPFILWSLTKHMHVKQQPVSIKSWKQNGTKSIWNIWIALPWTIMAHLRVLQKQGWICIVVDVYCKRCMNSKSAPCTYTCAQLYPVCASKCVCLRLRSAPKTPTVWNVLNTLRPRQHGRHFADDIFKHIFLNENVRISLKISLKFVPKGPVNNIAPLVQIMARRRWGAKPLFKPMAVRVPTHICVIRIAKCSNNKNICFFTRNFFSWWLISLRVIISVANYKSMA